MKILEIDTSGRGLVEFTSAVTALVRQAPRPDGLCTLFVRHTSASLVIQENADPSAARDLEAWFARLVPEHDPLFTHTTEGPDDMPSHVRAALTATSLSIPFANRTLALGMWQGIYLFEHRRAPHHREVAVHLS